MSGRQALVDAASSQLGYKEGVANRTKYGAWYGLPNDPWCAMFVSWCAARSGLGEGVILRFAYVPYGVDFFKRQGRWQGRGSGYTPRPGDIIFYGGPGSSGAHVGIVERAAGGRVYAIEGNTSANGNTSNGDGVYRRQRRLDDGWIMGYGCPDYGEDEDMESKRLSIKNLDSGGTVEVEAVNVAGSNFIRLRDVEKLFPVTVDWDGSSPTLKLNYTE